MPDVPSPLVRRPAGRCLTVRIALLAGFLALQAAAGTALAQTAAVPSRLAGARYMPSPRAAVWMSRCSR